MTDDAFMELVDQGIAALRPDIRARLTNVAIIITDEPTPEQRVELGLEPSEYLFGLYEGIPQTDRGLGGEGEVLLPDKITIFKLPILAAYTDPADIAACVENTIWHEVAHYFGMDEAEVEVEELRRGKVL